MGHNPNRPLSPHLGIYKRGPHMMVSIIHRATGFILATAGMITLIWWLNAMSNGAESYASFQKFVVDAGPEADNLALSVNWFFRLTIFAVVYSFFQHFYSGLRHLVMDMGAGYELTANRTWTWIVFIAAFISAVVVMLIIISRFLGV